MSARSCWSRWRLLPGMPCCRSCCSPAIAGGLAWRRYGARQRTKDDEAERRRRRRTAAPARGGADQHGALKMDELRLELGYGLLSLVNGDDGGPR